MSGSGVPVRDGLAWLSAHRFFHELSPRARVVLSQLPLTGTMVLMLGVVLFFRAELLRDPVFVSGLMLHALMFILAVVVPWHRLPPAASLAIPVLDFLPVGLVRESGVDTIPALGAMAVLPVVWLTSSQLHPKFGLVMSFLGPLLMVWVPLVLRGSVSGEEYSVVVLLPLLMLVAGFAVHTLSASMDHQQRTVEEARGQLQTALDSSARNERLINTVIDAVGVGVMALDAGGKVTLRNQEQKRNHSLPHPSRAFGGDAAEVRVYGRGGKEPLDPEMLPERRAARGEDFSDYLVWVGTDGKQRIFSTSARATKDDGRFDGSVVTFNDVTALVEAMTAKDAFLSNVTHELRAPLTSILGYTEMLAARDDVSPEAGVMLKVVGRNGQRLQRLVTDLLTAASGSVDVLPEPTDLAELIRFSLATAAPQAGAAGVNLVNEADARVPAMVDPTRMGQVLDNLLSNAIKYSPDGGTITVRAGATTEGVYCSVADTGIGMRQEDLKELFTKFFRAETVRNSGIPGIGLGLAITKTIVENHGGTITCTSTPGKGSTFTVTLPGPGDSG